MKIGSHVSMAGGLLGAAMEAYSYGANTFMIYTGAPQNTKRTPLSQLKIEEGHAFMREHNIEECIVHAPYIINMASCKDATYRLAKSFLETEMERTHALGARYLVMHPGSFTEMDLDYGINRIAEGLNEVFSKNSSVTILLETMAGKGSEVGKTFEELKRIMDLVEEKNQLGVCFDTCHVHDAGYDIVHSFDAVADEFDAFIGMDKIKVFHINGSLNKRGARKDRHANIGALEDNPKGKDEIGFDAIYHVVHHKKCADKFFILETPWLDAKTNCYAQEIKALKGGSI